MMDPTFLQARIEAIKGQIVAYEDAILALSINGGVTSYTLDTRQSRQTVTRADINSLNNTLNSLYNLLAMLEARLFGGNVTIARPFR